MEAIPLPVVAAGCGLDPDGLRAQLARYRAAGVGATVIECTPRRIIVEIGARVDDRLIEKLVAVEGGCCPFFVLSWEADPRRLSISVAAAEDEPALAAIASALVEGEWGEASAV
jgi:hypothetical protein